MKVSIRARSPLLNTSSHRLNVWPAGVSGISGGLSPKAEPPNTNRSATPCRINIPAPSVLPHVPQRDAFYVLPSRSAVKPIGRRAGDPSLTPMHGPCMVCVWLPKPSPSKSMPTRCWSGKGVLEFAPVSRGANALALHAIRARGLRGHGLGPLGPAQAEVRDVGWKEHRPVPLQEQS